MDFAARVRDLETTRGTRLAIALAPSLERMPYPMQRYDDPFLPYGRAVIDATSDIACAYVFDLAAYLSVGASGAIALERTIAYVPAPSLTILHGMFTRPEYARLLSASAFAADAATLATDDEGLIAAFVTDPTKGVFVETEQLLLSPGHDGQIGRMRKQVNGYVLELPALSESSIYWFWRGDIALASRGEDFQDAVRTAALRATSPA